MKDQDDFSEVGQERFLNYIKKQDFNDLSLDDEQWKEWLQILESLLGSPTHQVSSIAQ